MANYLPPGFQNLAWSWGLALFNPFEASLGRNLVHYFSSSLTWSFPLESSSEDWGCPLWCLTGPSESVIFINKDFFFSHNRHLYLIFLCDLRICLFRFSMASSCRWTNEATSGSPSSLVYAVLHAYLSLHIVVLSGLPIELLSFQKLHPINWKITSSLCSVLLASLVGSHNGAIGFSLSRPSATFHVHPDVLSRSVWEVGTRKRFCWQCL